MQYGIEKGKVFHLALSLEVVCSYVFLSIFFKRSMELPAFIR